MKDLKMYTLDEVAEIIQMTKRSIYTFIKKGELKAKKFGKHWRVSQEELRKFISQEGNNK